MTPAALALLLAIYAEAPIATRAIGIMAAALAGSAPPSG